MAMPYARASEAGVLLCPCAGCRRGRLQRRKVSNLEQLVDNAITLASKFASLWESSEYTEKQNIQNLVFPDGMVYCKKTNECRTPRINNIFRQITELNGISAENKNGDITLSSDVPAVVEPAGVEPASKHLPDMLSTCVLRH